MDFDTPRNVPCQGCEDDMLMETSDECTLRVRAKCGRIHRQRKTVQSHEIVTAAKVSKRVPLQSLTKQKDGGISRRKKPLSKRGTSRRKAQHKNNNRSYPEKFKRNRSGNPYATLITNIEIKRPKAVTYCISENSDPSNGYVVLYSSGYDRDVRVFDTKTGKIETFTCDKRIHEMCSLSATRHAMVEWTKDEEYMQFHLLNEHFQIICTCPQYSNGDMYEPLGVCTETQESCILLERTEDIEAPPGIRLTRVTVRNDKMSYKRIGEAANIDVTYSGICLSKDKITLFLAPNDSTLIKFNIKTMGRVTVDFSKYDPIGCWFEPSLNVYFIESKEGRIYVLHQNGKVKGVINNEGCVIKGAIARGKSLVFSVKKEEEKRIHMYNIV